MIHKGINPPSHQGDHPLAFTANRGLHIILPETERLLDGSADSKREVACILSMWRIDL